MLPFVRKGVSPPSDKFPLEFIIFLAPPLDTLPFLEKGGSTLSDKLPFERRNICIGKNKSWDLVVLPNDKKVVGYKWVYTLKKCVDDKVAKQ